MGWRQPPKVRKSPDSGREEGRSRFNRLGNGARGNSVGSVVFGSWVNILEFSPKSSIKRLTRIQIADILITCGKRSVCRDHLPQVTGNSIMLSSFFSWFGRVFSSISVHVQAVRKLKRQRNRSGSRVWQLRAIVNGVHMCSQYLAAKFTPTQYDASVSKLLAKVYRRFKWLVGSIVFLPSIDS